MNLNQYLQKKDDNTNQEATCSNLSKKNNNKFTCIPEITSIADLDLMKNINKNFKGITEITGIMNSDFMKNINKNFSESIDSSNDLIKSIEDANASLAAKQKEDYERELENHNNLERLVSINEKVLNKLNSLDDTLEFLNNAFVDKAKMDKEQLGQHSALLLELVRFLEDRDEDGLRAFINKVGTPVGIGLIVEYAKMKLGWSK